MRLPANTFSCLHESRGETTGTSTGTTLSANVTTNVKGSWTALGSATSFAYEGFTLHLASNAQATNFMLDIGIDNGSGSNVIIAADIYFAGAKQANEHNLALYLPIHVPAGSLLEARVASSTSVANISCLIVGHSVNPGGGPGFSRAVALFTPASSRGVTIDPGGSVSNTKGSWTQLTASTPEDLAALFGVVGFAGDTSRAATTSVGFALDIGIGASGAESVVLPDFFFGWSAGWDGPNDVFLQPFSAAIPSGSRVAARGQCTITTANDRAIDLALYGLVP